ncbi:MAG: HAMP domain-containing sensor histidine kinase [Flavobacteriales bacterium]|nr:HAMP domain-containing sensor histidine kinase [Flavobacteriales bacterium]
MSFVVTGGIAIFDHYEQKEKYNEQRLNRKEESVRASMNYFRDQMGDFIRPEVMNMVFSDKICELSDVHNLFIAVFDLQGNYLVSSSSFTMDSLAIPYQVSYDVMKGLTEKKRFVLPHTAHREDYTLAYWYFMDTHGKPIAITNVVYDNSDTDPKNIKLFLIELGQSYILLFLVALTVAYLLSRYITRSLQSIGIRMKGIELGGKMTPIRWDGDDEIGALVTQYNDMLLELERSANLMAKNERESAWREMAQQVAHEIKNPLTPMKLRVQYLQKAWEENAPNFDDRLKTFAQSMTEQIDTLSRIASEFSNFAKLPKPELKLLNLEEQCSIVIDLFKQQEHINITYRSYGEGTPILMADKDQVIRMLNNLLNNSIQAIPDDRIGNIEVALRNGQKHLIVRVMDNGCGISQEQRAKIFTPNFTTKSTGTGLGLAMIRNIMQQNGGEVRFTSKPNKSTSFFLFFPVQNS